MGQTTIPVGDARAVKKWSGALAVDVRKKSYFERKFVSTSQNAVIQRKTELESDAGDTITFDLSVQLRGKPTYGDARLQGREDQLRFYSDEVKIDQIRHAVSAGGRMTRKRTVHDLRTIAKERLSDYWSQFFDELFFIYLSGARGINEDFIEGTDWTGHAGNSLQTPDSTHVMYGGDATSFATIDSADTMSRAVIERAVVKAGMMRAQDPTVASMVPVTVEGEAHYILLMSPFQAYNLRNSGTSNEWLDIQKAASSAEGRSSPIFKGGLGMINNVVLHEHSNVIRFNNAGAGTNVDAARALFLGRQAGCVAYGTAGGMTYDWNEEQKDYGNELCVEAGTIVGFKKSRFNGKDFGALSIDTAATDPN